MESAFTILIAILVIAILAAIFVGVMFFYFWVFKQFCQIKVDAIGDKVVEVIRELKEEGII